MLVWISSGCLGMHLLIRNPLVNGAGDAMLCAVCDFFVISHLLSANMNEWIEAIATEAEWGSDWHVRLGHLGQYSGDEDDFKREVLPDNISWYISILESCACAWVKFLHIRGFMVGISSLILMFILTCIFTSSKLTFWNQGLILKYAKAASHLLLHRFLFDFDLLL